jgi:dTDP-4-dehydrorhamnose 3,5-epimerase
MIVRKTKLPDVVVVEPDVHGDARGFFLETWQAARYAAHGLDVRFVQDNLSYSQRGVLRGLHFQNPHAQGKLVSVLQGAVYDVVVDVRADAATFGQWVGRALSGQTKHQLYVPPGYAHGFVVTSEAALFHYKCTAPYVPEAEAVVRWDDPDLGIDWPVAEPVLSARDAAAPRLRDLPRERLVFGDAAA